MGEGRREEDFEVCDSENSTLCTAMWLLLASAPDSDTYTVSYHIYLPSLMLKLLSHVLRITLRRRLSLKSFWASRNKPATPMPHPYLDKEHLLHSFHI